MKQLLFPIAIISATLFSCQKQNSTDRTHLSLDGKWRMIIVKDNISRMTMTKPSSIQGDVDITFTTVNAPNGTFIGNTPTNNIGLNNFYVGPNQAITIPVLSMTKVMETSWGNEFVDNIRNSQEYNFEAGNRLNIKTTSKILTFQKL